MSGWGGPQGQNPYYGGQPPQQAPPNYGYGTAPGYQQQQAPGYAQQPPGYAQRPPGQVPGYAAQPPQQGYGQPPPRYGQPGQEAPPGYAQQAPPGYANQQQAYGAPPPQAAAGPSYGGGGGYNPMGGGYGPPPPPGISQDLWQWFQAVDQDRSGKITSTELQQALMNGNWTPFNAETCRLMIGMFDRDRSGTIDVQEFAALWKYIQEWKSCFDRFDTDRSGNIDANELHNAFRTFGYNLSPNFCNICVRVFDRRSCRTVNFDDFIQCCVMLKSLTEQFRQKDTNQSGVINISYEQFLEMVLENGQV